MNTKTRLSVVPLAMAVGLLGSWTVVKSWEGASTGGPLHRLAADFDFEGETSTAVGVYPASEDSNPGDDGRLVYQKTVSVPSDHNVLYVTFSATGDTHDGAALWLGCRVDGSDCNPGGSGGGSTPGGGYVPLQKMPSIQLLTGAVLIATCNDGSGGFGDCHDNNLNYTWCIPIEPCEWSDPIEHTVELRLATGESGKEVFFERSHFFIDSNNIQGNACHPFDTNALGETNGDAAAPEVVPEVVPPVVPTPTVPPLPPLP